MELINKEADGTCPCCHYTQPREQHHPLELSMMMEIILPALSDGCH